ncbi:Gfo/Idh/MocA family protein [Bradyrhizobium betae]|uniref:Gfo/Idh/MocA family protein n=1 Tax=Bradyrhizobium betae TaxID=244734 RepID=UPI003D66D6EB
MENGNGFSAPRRVLLVGLGRAGQRFKRALDYIQSSTPSLLVLAGIVDADPRRAFAHAPDVPAFTEVDEAVNAALPDAAIVCVSEESHFDVLRALAVSPVKVILCEKPLTATLRQAEQLEEVLRGKRLSLNMVERFSPVVPACMRWLAERPDLTVRRVEFFWGKHRIKDARPTIGVCSEVIHPLDLVRLIFPQTLTLQAAFGVESDLHVTAAPVLDSVFVMYQGRTCPVVGQSSFAWPGRDRRVVAYVAGKTDLFRITLEFDHPSWDCDRLEIHAIDETTGIYQAVFKLETSTANFPAELRHVYKVGQFLRHSLGASNGEPLEVPLVDYEEALSLQRVIEQLETETKRSPARFRASETGHVS